MAGTLVNCFDRISHCLRPTYAQKSAIHSQHLEHYQIFRSESELPLGKGFPNSADHKRARATDSSVPRFSCPILLFTC